MCFDMTCLIPRGSKYFLYGFIIKNESFFQSAMARLGSNAL